MLGLPNEANQFPPLLRMVGHTETVSTLVTVVGHPHKPALAGKGGLSLGFPGLPSNDSINPYNLKIELLFPLRKYMLLLRYVHKHQSHIHFRMHFFRENLSYMLHRQPVTKH